MLVLVTSHLQSCSFGNASERNEIAFKNSAQSVQDSLEVMNAFMDRLPKDEVINYFFDDENYLYLNSQKLTILNGIDYSHLLEMTDKLNSFSKQDIKHFVTIALFLKDNYMEGCYKHKVHGVYFYGYRQTEDNDYEDSRSIILIEKNALSVPASLSLSDQQLLDREDRLMLLAPKDVKIH